MPLEKMGEFSFNHSDQQNDIANVYDAGVVKQLFDSRSNELKGIVNTIIDVLQSPTKDDSGADNIKVSSIVGLQGDNVQKLLEALKKLSDDNRAYLLSQIQNIVIGQIPDGSITEVQLAEDVVQILNDFISLETDYVPFKQTTENHIEDSTIHKTSQTIREESTTPLRAEVVSSVGSETPTKARVVFDDATGKLKVGNGSAWV